MALKIYGKDFARIYHNKWDLWGRRMWPFIAKAIMRYRQDARGWLDLCCGTGTLLQLASERGFDAVGVDLSLHQLKYAKQKAPQARLVQSDVRQLALSRKFNVITCMFDSLNYLLSIPDLQSALQLARNHLSKKGLFFFDIKTREAFRNERNKIFHDAGQTIIFESSFDEGRALHSFLITGFVRQGRLYRRFVEEHIQRGYESRQIEKILSKISLNFIKYDGETFSHACAQSKRLLYLCSKMQLS